MKTITTKTKWFTFFCTLVFILFIGLGTWQMQRLFWKKELIASAEQKLAAPPLMLAVVWEQIQTTAGKTSSPSEPVAYSTTLQYEQCCDEACESMCGVLPRDQVEDEFTKVRVAGWFDYEHEIKLQAKYHLGKSGYRVLTPMRIGESMAVLVDRGWIAEKATYTPPAPGGNAISITGVIRKEIKRPLWFLPQNNAEKNLWFWPDIPVMTAYVRNRQGMNAPSYLPFYIQQTEGAGDGQPTPIGARPEFRNDHLGYALTWYALALVIPVMWFFYFKKQKK